MPLYCGVNGVKHKIKGMYTGIGGVKKELTEIWAAENGVKKLVYQSKIPLNDFSWDEISQAAQDGVASSMWSVGDRKAVALNGMCSKLTFSNETYYVYILGFDHNSSIEGANRIHFQFGYTALSGGKHICFISDFYMNDPYDDSGWDDSVIRNTDCPAFKSCLPPDLQIAVKSIIKYTDNKAYWRDDPSFVTPTTDDIFILSEYEVFGIRKYANSAEQNYQAQYQYYKNGNSRVRYQHDSLNSPTIWMLRSVVAQESNYSCGVSESGNLCDCFNGETYGFAPVFCV